MGSPTTVRPPAPAAEREIERAEFQGMFTVIHYGVLIADRLFERVAVVKNGKELTSLPVPEGLEAKRIIAMITQVAKLCGVEQGEDLSL